MNPPFWNRDRVLPLDYYLMLPHASDARVLLVREGSGWTLPRFTPEVTDFRRVRHINDHMSAQYGLASVVQRCIAQRYDPERGQTYRIYVLEHLSSTSPLPEGGRWINAAELDDVPITIPEHREMIRRWLQEAQTPTAPEWRAPWTHTGWFDEASNWIQAQLTRLDLKALGPVVQERAWALSCMLRLESSMGDVYFKAVPPFMAQEAAVMRDVSRQHPELIPPPLATDVQRGWVLTAEFGGNQLIHTPDLSRWEEALRRFAQMQVAQAEHIYDWLVRGVPDRRLNRMVAMIDPLMADATELLSGSPQGLLDREVEGLHALSMKLKLLCANLAGYQVPHTLVHGDLSGNILVQDDRYLFLDWSDVCIAHPFFDMATIIETALNARTMQHEREVRTRLRDAYLAPWTSYEPMERLVHAFELSTSLGALHQAMSYMWILMNLAEDAHWELESGLVMWLRRLLQLLPPGL